MVCRSQARFGDTHFNGNLMTVILLHESAMWIFKDFSQSSFNPTRLIWRESVLAFLKVSSPRCVI